MAGAGGQSKRKAVNLGDLARVTLFLIGGVALVAFARLELNMTGDFVFVALLFLPIISWAMVTGRIEELSLGGTKAKFRAVAPVTILSSRLGLDQTLARAFLPTEAGAPTIEPLGTSQMPCALPDRWS